MQNYILIFRENSNIYCHPSLDSTLHTSCHSCNQCIFLVQSVFGFHMITFPTYLQSTPCIDPPPAHRPYLVLQLECISNGIKGFLPSGCHFAASAARFICTKGFHPCQIPPGPTRKQCIDEQLTPFSTSQCKLTVRFQQQRLHGIFHLTYTVSAHSVICILV